MGQVLAKQLIGLTVTITIALIVEHREEIKEALIRLLNDVKI